jgi:hypothetical protein
MIKYYHLMDKVPFVSNAEQKNYRAKYTGEFRAPKKDEWFISGAIPQAYRAYRDMYTPYYIARIVKVKIIISFEEVD